MSLSLIHIFTEQSVFFHGIIYNSSGRRKLLEDVVHFTSTDALTGYLQYVFLPTAFLSFTNEEKGIIVPLGLSLAELIEYVGGNDFVRFHNYQAPMYRLLEMLTEASHEEGEMCIRDRNIAAHSSQTELSHKYTR